MMMFQFDEDGSFARRRRRRGIAGAFLFGLLITVGTFGWSAGFHAIPATATPPPAPAPQVPVDDSDRVTPVTAPRISSQILRARMEPGGTLAAALGRAGVAANRQARITRGMARFLDMRRLPASTGVSVTIDVEGEVRAVAIRSEPERFLRLTFSGDLPPRSETIALPVVTTMESVGATIDSSLAQALSVLPAGTQLTNEFADMFQWDLDLLTDPRRGDRVRIVYEARRLGQIPVDLPEFVGAAQDAGQMLAIGRILAASYEGAIAQSTGFWVAEVNGVGGYFDADGSPLRKAFLKSPLNYRRISSGFNSARRHLITRRVVPHHGIDFAAAPGTPVVATADGRVTFVGWRGSLGKAVKIQHGGTYVTIYGHLQDYAMNIQAGTQVKQNQVIGYVGSTGRATGPHLHYTMIRAGRAINPMALRTPPAEPLPEEQRPWLARAQQRLMPILASIDFDRGPALQPALGELDRHVDAPPGS